jgi:hypothetical protein
LVGVIALLLVLAQIFLPKLAASRISSRLGRYGKVDSVSVKARPAVKLLWGHADSVTVKARSLSVSPAQTAKLLWEARGLNDIDVTVASANEGRVRLSAVSLRKRGNTLAAQARVSAADVKAALPDGLRLELLSTGGGEVAVRASGGLFGVRASVDAVAGASEGRLIARPQGSFLEGLKLTLFSEPHVYVEGVGAIAASGPSGPASYRLTITASLR